MKKKHTLLIVILFVIAQCIYPAWHLYLAFLLGFHLMYKRMFVWSSTYLDTADFKRGFIYTACAAASVLLSLHLKSIPALTELRVPLILIGVAIFGVGSFMISDPETEEGTAPGVGGVGLGLTTGWAAYMSYTIHSFIPLGIYTIICLSPVVISFIQKTHHKLSYK